MDPSFIAIPLVFFLGFLSILGAGLVFAMRGLLRSGGDSPGSAAARAFGALFLAVALIALGGLGAAGCLFGTIALAANHAVHDGPIRAFTIERVDEPTDYERSLGLSSQHRLHLSLKVRGAGDFDALREWLERESNGDVRMSVTTRDENGTDYSYLDFALPVDEYDLEELEREISREFPGLELPDGLRIEIEEGR